MAVEIGERLDALEQILGHGERYELFGRSVGPDADHLGDVLTRSRARLRHGSSHTIVALAGSTGSGKSSLFNALAGVEVATVGVRRPTTATSQALVIGEPADELVAWLGVSHHHNIAAPGAAASGAAASGAAASGADAELPDGLVLVDLPDHDSVEDANRAEVDRLVSLVDVFVWVADPQKYGDELLHSGYLKRLAEHGDVMLFVLTKTDLLSAEGIDECQVDFARLVRADGIADPRVLPVSTYTGAGLAVLREAIAEAVDKRNAAVLRTEADLRVLGSELSLVAETHDIDHEHHDRVLVSQLTDAVDGDAAAAIVAAHHRHQGKRALGWPPTRWFARWRRSPARELPTASNSPTLVPQVSSALRDYAQARTADLPIGWQRAARDELSAGEGELVTRLGGVSGRALRTTTTDRPSWWNLGVGAQWIATAVAAVGLVWLIALFVVESFLQVEIDRLTPDWRGIPLPTWLLLGGLLASVVLTLVLRAFVAVGARRRQRQARGEIERELQAIADDSVIAVLNLYRNDAHGYQRLTAVLRA